MVMDSKSVKVYETEVFTQLTRGARLFRCSSSANDSVLSPEKQQTKEATEAEDGHTSTKTELTEASDSESTAGTSTTNVTVITNIKENPLELTKSSNFIDRRPGTIVSEREILCNQDRSSKRKDISHVELPARIEMLSVSEQENGVMPMSCNVEAALIKIGREKRAEGLVRSCQTCGEEFDNAAAQRRHYQLDWHRCNLHRALKGRLPVSEEQFAELVDADDVSSISGSESESEGDSSPEASTNEGEAGVGPESQRHARAYFETAGHRVFSLHRCLLHSKKETTSEEQLMSACRALPSNTRWAVILAGGGHFAAAIFHGGEVALRKTFHTYTVRRGQGTAQSVRDSRGNAPKSAGAALRRRNELTLQQDVHTLLESWCDELGAVSLVFVRATPAQKSWLFGGRRPVIGPRDPRLRPLPFPTRRATLAECRRAHDLLATVMWHGPAQAFRLSLQAEVAPSIAKPATLRASNRDASREPPERHLPPVPSASSSDDCSDAGPELQTELMTLDFNALREYQTKPRRPRKPRRGKRAGGKAAPAQGSKAAQTSAPSTMEPAQLAPGDVAPENVAQGASEQAQEGNEEGRTERRAALRRLRRDRLRERRADEERQRLEQEERQRFMQLSDREKRALAAERRLATAGAPAVLARCHLCAVDMTGQVPFCYLDMRFCSVPCLQAHRRANT